MTTRGIPIFVLLEVIVVRKDKDKNGKGLRWAKIPTISKIPDIVVANGAGKGRSCSSERARGGANVTTRLISVSWVVIVVRKDRD